MAAKDHWLMGYLPEQQLDGLLGHAISEGSGNLRLLLKIQFLANVSFPMQIKRLAEFGLKPEAFQILSDEDLDDENNLKAAIRNFTRYVQPLEGEMIGESPFDAVVFAGDPAFALRTAPVLAYYDVGRIGRFIWAMPCGSNPAFG